MGAGEQGAARSLRTRQAQQPVLGASSRHHSAFHLALNCNFCFQKEKTFRLGKLGHPDGRARREQVFPGHCLGTGQRCFSRTQSRQIPSGNMENNHFPRRCEVPRLAAPEQHRYCQSWEPEAQIKTASSRRDEWSQGSGPGEEGEGRRRDVPAEVLWWPRWRTAHGTLAWGGELAWPPDWSLHVQHGRGWAAWLLPAQRKHTSLFSH